MRKLSRSQNSLTTHPEIRDAVFLMSHLLLADKGSRRDDPYLIPQVISGLADANAWGNQEKDLLACGGGSGR
jgi:hypothetical protein